MQIECKSFHGTFRSCKRRGELSSTIISSTTSWPVVAAKGQSTLGTISWLYHYVVKRLMVAITDIVSRLSRFAFGCRAPDDRRHRFRASSFFLINQQFRGRKAREINDTKIAVGVYILRLNDGRRLNLELAATDSGSSFSCFKWYIFAMRWKRRVVDKVARKKGAGKLF